jgi:hypothetical protein
VATKIGSADADMIVARSAAKPAIYFILNPADFWAFIDWAQHLLFH